MGTGAGPSLYPPHPEPPADDDPDLEVRPELSDSADE